MGSWPVRLPDAPSCGCPEPEEVAERYDLFINAAARWLEAVDALSKLTDPTLARRGRGIGSLTLRARELAGKHAQLAASVDAAPVEEPTGARTVSAPAWLEDEMGLRDAVALVAEVCADVLERAAREEPLGRVLGAFERALPALAIALRGLPRLQETCTHRLWREEFLG